MPIAATQLDAGFIALMCKGKGTSNSDWPQKYPSWFVYKLCTPVVITKFHRERDKNASNGFFLLERTKLHGIIWLGWLSLTLESLELIFFQFVAVRWLALITLESSVRLFTTKPVSKFFILFYVILKADKNCSWKEGIKVMRV